MSFYTTMDNISWEAMEQAVYGATTRDVHQALSHEEPPDHLIPALLSPAADSLLEEMAQLSRSITRERFGNIIQLYAPVYLSNECSNHCLYCGFNAGNDIQRVTLSLDELMDEVHALRAKGFQHLLLLTGEHKKAVPVSYMAEAVEAMHRELSSVSIEVYPMEVDEYRQIIDAGADGLTLYQETYHRETYARLHPAGKKRDFQWRLDGPDRGGKAGFRKIGIGSLLGLADWRIDGAFTLLHARHLTTEYWKSHIQVSFPRIQAAEGSFVPPIQVGDRDLAHLIAASRVALHDASLVLSTRERAKLRDNLVPFGITSMSAGSRTEPGGYLHQGEHTGQFAVSDERSPEEISTSIKEKGYEAVWKDWDREFIR